MLLLLLLLFVLSVNVAAAAVAAAAAAAAAAAVAQEKLEDKMAQKVAGVTDAEAATSCKSNAKDLFTITGSKLHNLNTVELINHARCCGGKSIHYLYLSASVPV